LTHYPIKQKVNNFVIKIKLNQEQIHKTQNHILFCFQAEKKNLRNQKQALTFILFFFAWSFFSFFSFSSFSPERNHYKNEIRK